MRKLIVILCALFFITACQKKATDSVSLDKHPLLAYLPASTVGLAICSKESSAGYKNYQSSEMYKRMSEMNGFAWGSDLGAVMQDRLGQSELPKLMLALRDSLFDASREKSYKEAVLYVSPTSDYKMFDIGWLANTYAPVDLVGLKSSLKSQNYELKDELIQGNPGFSLTLTIPDKTEKLTFYFLSGPTKVAIGSNSQILSDFIAGKAGASLSNVAITTHPGYSAARAYFGSQSAELCYGYLEAESLVKAIKSDIPEAELAQIPLTWLGFSSSFLKDGLRTKISLALKDSSGEWMKNLSSGSIENISSLVPSGSVLSTVLDGGLIAQMKTLAESRPEVQNSADAKARLDLVGSLKGLGVTIKNSDGASLFPEVLFVARTEKVKEVAELLKESLLTSFGVQGLEWHEKEINGQRVSFFLTPLGIGAYLVEGDKLVMAGTTEGIIQTAISLQAKKPGDMAISLSDEMRASAMNGSGIISGLINYTELAKTLDSVQASLATFSGGNSKVDPQMLNNLRAMGSTFFQIGIAQGQLSVDIVQK